MPISIDPLFILQLMLALLIVATIENKPAKEVLSQPERDASIPFQLSDGKTYVDHAGMTIEQELYLSLSTRRQGNN